MANNNNKGSCWFGWMKKIFTCKLSEKKLKRGKWKYWISRRLRFRQHHAAVLPPTTTTNRQLTEARERQKNYALTVAIATAAAAEAAVVAAKAAAELVHITATTSSSSSHARRLPEPDRNWAAAVLIQSVFRAYLARKALRALKGVVKLQAIVRGQSVRRQFAIIRLKHLTMLKTKHNDDSFQGKAEHRILESINSLTSSSSCSHRSWDFSRLSKEDIEILWSRKQEGNIKRDRMMRYSFSHRERRNTQILEELLLENDGSGKNGRSNWIENLRLVPMSTSFNGELTTETTEASSHLKHRNHTTKLHRDDGNYDCSSPSISSARRSIGHTQGASSSTRDKVNANANESSQALPTYMAATQSTRARTRSMSTPRQRLGGIMRQSLWSSDHHHGEVFGCDDVAAGKSGCGQEMPFLKRKVHHRGFSLASSQQKNW